MIPKAMKLYLYQDLRYLCIQDSLTFFDHLQNLDLLREKARTDTILMHDEEILCAASYDTNISGDGITSSIQPLFFGAGPLADAIVAENLPKGYTVKAVESGDYLFYQFADPSPEGIDEAVNSAYKALLEKNWKTKDDTILLRGVKEVGFYVLQILFPLA